MSGTTPTSLSTAEMWDRLEKAQSHLNEALNLLTVGEACGYDCQQQRKQAQDYQSELDRVRQALFPRGRPRR